MENRRSQLAGRLVGQPMFEILAKAQRLEEAGKSVIHFELGDTSFQSPNVATDSAIQALRAGQTKYVNSSGMIEFREEIASYTQKTFSFEPRLDQIVVAPANALIDFVIRCCVDPGDEVLIPDPCFPTYSSVLSYTSITPVRVPLLPENAFRISPDTISSKITNKTRLIIINSPNNPTGALSTPEEIEKIVNIAKKHNIYLLSDEVYQRLSYGEQFVSAGVFGNCETNTIILNSMSKIFSMSGWRAGYVIGPSSLMKSVGLLSQTTLSCSPPFVQIGAASVLSSAPDIIDTYIGEYSDRRDAIVDGLNSIKGVACVKPGGAFYVFPKVTHPGMDTMEYCSLMLEEAGVCTVPGEHFGPRGKGHIRMCYSGTSVSEIKQAITLMQNFHKKYFN